jgi:hypothetical protein
LKKYGATQSATVKAVMDRLTAIAEKVLPLRELIAAAERQKLKSVAEKIPCDVGYMVKNSWFCKVDRLELRGDQVMMDISLHRNGADTLPPYIQWRSSLSLPAMLPNAESAVHNKFRSSSWQIVDDARRWFLGVGALAQVSIGRQPFDQGLGVLVRPLGQLW